MFENRLNWFIDLIYKKVFNNTYKFVPYKEKLLVKSRDRNPRLLSIPAIRDKITLGLLKDLLHSSFENDIKHQLVQSIINDIKNSINKYDYFLKVDIENFYGSLNHDILLKKLHRRIRKPEIVSLVRKAITTPTISDDNPLEYRNPNIIGIPQGLSISNILASIYLLDFDNKYANQQTYKYFRYVDDILILCNNQDKESIIHSIKDDLESIALKINSEKTTDGYIADGFTYLGYEVKNYKFCVRKKTVQSLERSLEYLFSEFKNSGYQRSSFFVWKLNLRITGCRLENNKYGWVFFFSQIEDLTVLFHLDWLVQSLIKRFNVSKNIKGKQIKKFIRTHHEIVKKLHTTSYIPRLDTDDISVMSDFLTKVCEIDINGWNQDRIIQTYNSIVTKTVTDLEKDFQSFS